MSDLPIVKHSIHWCISYPEMAAVRIRELEADVARALNHADGQRMRADSWQSRAEAAEAKLLAVEKLSKEWHTKTAYCIDESVILDKCADELESLLKEKGE